MEAGRYQWSTSLHMLSLYLCRSQRVTLVDNRIEIVIPLKIYSLDDKTQCRTDSGDLFIHNLLDNGGLPGIVQTSVAMAVSEGIR